MMHRQEKTHEDLDALTGAVIVVLESLHAAGLVMKKMNASDPVVQELVYTLFSLSNGAENLAIAVGEDATKLDEIYAIFDDILGYKGGSEENE